VRARDVFCRKRIVVISQEFHDQRVIFIASHNGIDAIGFNADEVDAYGRFMTGCRDQFARVKTLFDVYLFKAKPGHLGNRIEIGVQPPVPPGGIVAARVQDLMPDGGRMHDRQRDQQCLRRYSEK
jgi:vancomycin permeability regulator SanA